MAEAVDKLAAFLRYNLSLGEDQVPLKNELEQLYAYIYFQKQRYRDEINVNIDVEDDLLECKTVKLLLQPLVENAIYHGRKASGALLNITIYTFSDDQTYSIVVEDDGNGMSREKIDEVLSGRTEESVSSIGLRNVIDRLRICSGGKGELLIDSKLECYTKITIKQMKA